MSTRMSHSNTPIHTFTTRIINMNKISTGMAPSRTVISTGMRS